jgi:hypothetical protein
MNGIELPAPIDASVPLLADDLVWGSPAIAAEIGRDERAALYMLKAGKLVSRELWRRLPYTSGGERISLKTVPF